MKRLTLVGVVIGACLLSTFPVSADMPEGLLQTLNMKVDAQLRETVKELVSPEYVARELFLDWPVNEVTATPESLDMQVRKLVKQDAKEKYPFSLVTNFEKAKQAEFRQYEPGQTIQLTTRKGELIKGMLREIKRDIGRIVINNAEVRLDDLDEDSYLHFDALQANQRIRSEVRRETAQLDARRKEYEQSVTERRERELYEAAGYLQLNGTWRPRTEYYAEAVEKRETELQHTLRPMLKWKVYSEAGLVYFNQTWMTKEDAEEQKRLLEEARRAAAAAAAAAAAPAATAEDTAEPAPKPVPKEEDDDIWE